MLDKYHALQSLLIAALLSAAFEGKTNYARPTLIEQTLQAIQECMVRAPVPWPEEWKQEYVDTIGRAIELHQDTPDYAERLEILRKGFGPYWESFKKTTERSLFDVHRTRIRWYVEHLMGSEFPTDQERQRVRDQFTDIWDHAAESLLAQFPFLDPNGVQKAKADDLSVCYRKIDAPLMPVYLRPMSEEHVAQIKQRWDDLRYARVDLWRNPRGNSAMAPAKNSTPSPNAERDYELAKESLSQLLGLVWMVVPQRPDYYIEALENRTKELQRRLQTKQKAQADQQRLEKERSRQLLQAEHISFLLAALLETPLCLEEGPSVVTQDQNPLEQQENRRKEVVPMR